MSSTNRTSTSAGWVGGKRLKACRWCDGPIPKGRRTFCSQECVDEHCIRSDPGVARRKVFERDRGVCRLCGLDTRRLEALVNRYRRMCFGHWGRVTARRPWSCYEGKGPQCRNVGEVTRVFRLLGLEFSSAGVRSSYWDMDHEIPVIEGGGECGLDNLRTLCLWCHKRETKRLARRRARQRRKQTALFGEDVLDADLEVGGG